MQFINYMTEEENLKKELEEVKAKLKEKEETTSALQNYLGVMDLKVQVLQAIGNISGTSFDLDKLLDSVMDMIIDAMKTEAGSLLLLDEDTQLLEFKVAKGEKADEVKKFKLKIGEGIVGKVAEIKQPVILPSADAELYFSKNISEELEFKARNILAVPLLTHDKVIGVVELINKKDRRKFIKEDLDLLTSLAGQITLVIENAKLFAHAQEKVKEFSTLINVSKIINSTLDLSKVLSEVMEIATVMVDAETSSIFLIDKEKNELYIEVATGEAGKKVKQIRIPITEGIVGWVVKENKSILVADAQNDPRFYKRVDENSKFITKSVIAVPLKLKDRMIGVMEVLNKMGNETFTNSDVSIIEALAHQSAIAIDNALVHKDLQELFLNTIKSLALAVESKDTYTGGHIERISRYSMAIVEELNLNDIDKERIHWAALFHDIGKIGVDEAILRKPGRLTEEEFNEMKKHPEIGANILKPVKQFNHIIPGILDHQERYDGKGYPRGIKGEEISLDGRIIAVADTYDAMTSDRPYRKGLPENIAIDELKRCAGTQFDAKIVEAFLSAYNKGLIK
ncbi:MAG: HD domain-containing phosphohydrolase [Candidatus Firestonebacteria bacterium]